MRKINSSLIIVFSLLVLTMVLTGCHLPGQQNEIDAAANVTNPDASMGESRANPIPFGNWLSIPGWNVRVIEFLRGEAAMAFVNSGLRSFEPPPEGYEYALAKLAVRCTADDSSIHYLSLSEMFITGSGNLAYTDRMDGWPQPEFLFEDMYTAELVEGWIDALVSVDETHLMVAVDVETDSQRVVRYLALSPDETGLMLSAGEISPDTVMGTSPAAPAGLNQQVVSTGWEVEILSALRGDDAMVLLRQEDENFSDSEEGFEYLLLEASVQYDSRVDEPALISNYNFYAVDDEGNMLDKGRVRFPSQSPLVWINQIILPGAAVEGWVIVSVPEGIPNPIIAFDLLDYTSDLSDSSGELRYFSVE